MFFNNKNNEIDTREINKFFRLSNNLLRFIYILAIILVVLVGTYLIKEWQILNIIGKILIVISPVFIGFIIAWLLDPLATKLSKKMPRIVACILTYLIMIGIIALAITFVIPSISNGITDIVESLPRIIDTIQNFASDTLGKLGNSSSIAEYKNAILTNIENYGTHLAESLPNSIWTFGKSAVNIIINISLGFVIGFYLLFDFRKLHIHILSLIPNYWHNSAKELMERVNGKLRNYVQGLLFIMTLVFITQTISFSLIGLKAPVLFAIFCAITDIIPYVGPWIGGVPAVIVGFTISPTVGILTLIAIFICQILENNFYQPLIMGHTLKLHPVTIIVGLLIFEHFFGIFGLVIATPCIACLKVILVFIAEQTKIIDFLKEKKDNIKIEPAEEKVL